MFRKILIANRGEIAVRVMRACREMGISSVAIFSDVDRKALHVSKADEAYLVGPAPARESYLNIAKILEVARSCGAEAIHPGYGFLSENTKFAKACAEAGIKFIGPPPSAMELMGSKTRARTAMQAAGVPMVPGSARGLSLPEAEEMAAKVGYPVMIKAAAGGGGKGMRLVKSPAELKSSFETAQSEALRSFNDGEVYVEKFIENPRHIEIQVLGDENGNVVKSHLNEPLLKQIADANLARVDVRLDFGARTDAPRDDVAVGMVARLLRREEPGVDLLLDVGMVLRQLLERAVTTVTDEAVCITSPRFATRWAESVRKRAIRD